eukprot:5925856-Amphidinium_carterae.1
MLVCNDAGNYCRARMLLQLRPPTGSPGMYAPHTHKETRPVTHGAHGGMPGAHGGMPGGYGAPPGGYSNDVHCLANHLHSELQKQGQGVVAESNRPKRAALNLYLTSGVSVSLGTYNIDLLYKLSPHKLQLES